MQKPTDAQDSTDTDLDHRDGRADEIEAFLKSHDPEDVAAALHWYLGGAEGFDQDAHRGVMALVRGMLQLPLDDDEATRFDDHVAVEQGRRPPGETPASRCSPWTRTA